MRTAARYSPPLVASRLPYTRIVESDRDRPLSALPSPLARALAFVSILLGGVAGGLIGAGFIGLQCHGSCATPKAVGGLVGSVVAAIGTSVVAVLALRAMGEWKMTGRR
jgi:hypothetical protein